MAERAGTRKTALYRRWSSKTELVHEAAFPAAPTALDTPVGDIAADARVMTRFTDLFGAVRVRLDDAIVRGEVHGEIDPDRG